MSSWPIMPPFTLQKNDLSFLIRWKEAVMIDPGGDGLKMSEHAGLVQNDVLLEMEDRLGVVFFPVGGEPQAVLFHGLFRDFGRATGMPLCEPRQARGKEEERERGGAVAGNAPDNRAASFTLKNILQFYCDCSVSRMNCRIAGSCLSNSAQLS